MKAIVFALLATVFYTAETVIADNKFSKVTPMAITFLMGVLAILVSGVGLSISKQPIVWPSQSQAAWVTTVVVLAYLADLLHFYSLHYRVGAVVLCTSYALMPVFATIGKGEAPSVRLVFAWIFGAIALFLAFKDVPE